MASSDEDVRLVAIGTVGDPVEAGMIREYLASHGIDCMVQGEHHRSMLQTVGFFIELRLLVPSSQAEEAAALLRDFRQGSPVPADGEEVAGPDDEDADPDEPEDTDQPAEGGAPEDWRESIEARRNLARARLLALVVPGFGLGHFAVGARLRGVILVATWPVAFWLASRAGPTAFFLVLLSAAFDFLATPSAAADVRRRRARVEVPRAKLLEGRPDRE
jgi:Putative prokaryotic signal transducing protein